MGTFVDAVEDDASIHEYYDRLRSLVVAYAEHEVTSVAVVGNQPLPESAGRAEMIDSADLVFRVNGFAVDVPGSARSVGRRTDVVVFNRGVRPTPWFFRDYRHRLYLLIEPGRMLWENERVPAFWPTDLGFVTLSNREVILPLSAELGLDSLGQGIWATTGTTMLWIAAMLFPEARIDATGFSFVDAPDQSSWDHAFGAASAVGAEHEIAREGALLRRWSDEGRIAFHR